VLEHALQTYCDSALVSSATQKTSPVVEGSQLGCADALRSLKRNWWQHQLLAVVWLVFVLVLSLGLLVCHLLRQPVAEHIPCCARVLGMSGIEEGLGLLGRSTHNCAAPWYHPASLDCNDSRRAAYRVLHVIRACWSVAASASIIALAVVVMPGSYQALWGRLIDMCRMCYYAVTMAEFAVAMLLSMPTVLSAYGFLDFARVRLSPGACVLLFVSCAWVMFLFMVVVVGVWFTVWAYVFMIVALFGVPEHKLPGNKLNVCAYTTMRFMCQGLVAALPYALISSAAINALLVTDACDSTCKALLWASLLLSLSRFAAEVFCLAVLTHRLRARCFVTAIVDIIHHLQPHQAGTPGGSAAPPSRALSRRVHDSPSGPCMQVAEPAMLDLVKLEPGLAAHRHGGPNINAQAQVAPGAAAGDVLKAPIMDAEQSATQGGGSTHQAGGVSMQLAAQQHSSSVADEHSCCSSSWAGQAGWPQQYPKFTVVYVWVVSLLVAVFVCVVCSQFIWPWLFVVDSGYNSYTLTVTYSSLLVSPRPYSLLDLWSNWRLSGSVKGSLAALGWCDWGDVTCNLTAV
jgi:hypothetical protein